MNNRATLPRPEYPRPQFVRAEWINLNGSWTYSFDFGKTGMERGFTESRGFEDTIIVPFAPESALSGVGYTDFIERFWYQRPIDIPTAWRGKRVILHFGAVDYETEVYIDGTLIGRHWGGSSSFSMDISPWVQPGGTHNLVVHVIDELRQGHQTGGKQSIMFQSAGCLYTRVTGIWQTVWLEAVPLVSLARCQIVPDLDDPAFCFIPAIEGGSGTEVLKIHIRFDGATAGEGQFIAMSGIPKRIPLSIVRPWAPEHPNLYDITFEILSSSGVLLDRVQSYNGLRKIEIVGDRLHLNGAPRYLRFVLDQGYYPDGIWTAPSDDDLRRDVELGQSAGFNGARLHQKVFEPRFHYWADRLGYLTWGESANWGLDCKSEIAARNFLHEWREVVLRDRNHPSIIAWTTLNETWDISNRRQHSRLHAEAYDLTRALDPTRPVSNASGGCHVKTDLYTVHIYEQDPSKLAQKLAKGLDGSVYRTLGDKEAAYEGQPYLVDEFGGIQWVPDLEHLAKDSWGYGSPPRTLDEFYERLDGQVHAIVRTPHICGYCYTQLTDVEQEQNGIYTYDRTRKFDMNRIRRIFTEEPDDLSAPDYLRTADE